MLARAPQAMQLRQLQTLITQIMLNDRPAMIVFPFPMELLRAAATGNLGCERRE